MSAKKVLNDDKQLAEAYRNLKARRAAYQKARYAKMQAAYNKVYGGKKS